MFVLTEVASEGDSKEETVEDRVARVFDIARAMPKRQPYMAGYPKYVCICHLGYCLQAKFHLNIVVALNVSLNIPTIVFLSHFCYLLYANNTVTYLPFAEFLYVLCTFLCFSEFLMTLWPFSESVISQYVSSLVTSILYIYRWSTVAQR